MSDNASCPKCGHYNAMLALDFTIGRQGEYKWSTKCRDCGHVVMPKSDDEGAMDKEKTPVIFRMLKPNREAGESRYEVLALFPTLPGTNDRHTCESYQHVGQHGAADLNGCVRRSRPAKPAEYADLAKELRSIGYNLDIKQRATYAMDKIRHKALGR